MDKEKNMSDAIFWTATIILLLWQIHLQISIGSIFAEINKTTIEIRQSGPIVHNRDPGPADYCLQENNGEIYWINSETGHRFLLVRHWMKVIPKE